MIKISRTHLLRQLYEEFGQLLEPEAYAQEDTLVFEDAHDMATKLNNALENAIIETDKQEA